MRLINTDNPIFDLMAFPIVHIPLLAIVGEMPLNGDTWDIYMETIESMGLDEAVQIKQDALDIYLANSVW